MSAIIPVVLFAYRRADLLARTLAALRANDVKRIHAFSDGPRGDTDAADIETVRRTLRAVDWAECSVVKRDVNLGLNESLLCGITEVLTEYNEIVVCEDDIELAPGAYGFLCAALQRYRDDERVMCVGAWTHPRVTPPDARDAPHFDPRFGGWGWGTWRRAWTGMRDHTSRELREECLRRGIDVMRVGRDLSDAAELGDAHEIWDYRFSLHILLHHGLCLVPPRSLATHIGFDARASNSASGVMWDAPAVPAPPLDSIRWPAVAENPHSAALWRLAMNPQPVSFASRVWRRVDRLREAGAWFQAFLRR